MPIATLTYSGGKSLHAVVRIDAEDHEDWETKVKDLYSWLAENGIDQNNKNASRLTRIPGVERGDRFQYLIDTDMGCSSYTEWMKKCMKPEFFQKPEEGKKGPTIFRHDWMGNWIIKTEGIKRIDGSICLYDEETRSYQFDTPEDRKIRCIVRNYVPSLKDNQVREVEKYIYDKFPRAAEQKTGDSQYIAFLNGVIDLEDGFKFKQALKSMNITSVIPHEYINFEDFPDEQLKSETNQKLEIIFNDWADGDVSLSKLLNEIIGSCLESRIEPFQRAFMLDGDPSSGKSTYITLLEKILGKDNYSSLELVSLNDRFHKIHLRGKKANICNDITHISIKDPSSFKKAVTGDEMNGEFKGRDLVSFHPFATHVYSCNLPPNIRDDRGGIARRLVYVPFRAHFEPSPKQEAVSKFIFSEFAIQMIIFNAINALKEAMINRSFTIPECCLEKAKENQILDNSVLSWIYSNPEIYSYHQEKFIPLPSPEEVLAVVGDNPCYHYRDYDLTHWQLAYNDYCKESGNMAVGNKRFKQEIESFYKVKWKRIAKRIDGRVCNIYIPNKKF